MAELVPTLGFLLNVGESGDVIDVRSEILVVQCKSIMFISDIVEGFKIDPRTLC